MSNSTIYLNHGKIVGDIMVACQGYYERTEFFGGMMRSISSAVLLEIALALTFYNCVLVLLKPIGMPNVAQLLAGFLVGPLYKIYAKNYSIHEPTLILVSSMLSQMGFYLHLFLLALEINLRRVARTGKKAIVISIFSIIMSLAFSYGTLLSANMLNLELIGFYQGRTFPVLIYNASNFLMSTSSHLNDLGISNSKLGQLASSASMILDMSLMLLSILLENIILPIKVAKEYARIGLLFYYALLFFGFRPFILYVLSLKPEGKPLNQIHFVVLVVSILVLAFLSQCTSQKLSPFLLALSLPEEPLATILAQKLDPFASNIFFPFFIISRGVELELPNFVDTYVLVLVLAMGYLGKFFGTLISARLFRIPFSEAITLSLIMSARGVLDIAILFNYLLNEVFTKTVYSVCIAHSFITMGVLLPIAKLLYEPSKEYTSIMRHSIINLKENNDVLKILVCIYKEENIPGLTRILKVCHSSPETPITVMALQLLQLTGRCTMPVMAPLHEVSSISSLRSNIERCTNTVNSFLFLEHEAQGWTRVQHFVAMSPYSTMHNDICNLAYEKTVELVILPFHIVWDHDRGTIKDTSLSIREVNNKVLKKIPCSIGILIDRSSGSRSKSRFQQSLSRSFVNDDSASSSSSSIDEEVYKISVIFVGGADDYEALAYSKFFANHPSVRLNVLWLKSPIYEENNEVDYEVMNRFQRSCENNDRITFSEAIVNSGDETVQVIVSIKDEVDLVVTGIYHDLESMPLLGLSDGWTEYPELGVLGDVFASPDFDFSLLVVQQEPQLESSLNFKK